MLGLVLPFSIAFFVVGALVKCVCVKCRVPYRPRVHLVDSLWVNNFGLMSVFVCVWGVGASVGFVLLVCNKNITENQV